MSEPDDKPDSAAALEQRVARLENEASERTISDAYARFYAPLAIVALALSAVPLYKPVQVSEGVRRTFDTTWEMAGNHGGDPAVLGILLLVGLVTVMSVAAVRTKSAALPISIAVLSALIVTMILAKPGTGTPRPDLTNEAIIGVVFSVAIVAISIAHAAHLLYRRRHNPELYRPAVAPAADANSDQ